MDRRRSPASAARSVRLYLDHPDQTVIIYKGTTPRLWCFQPPTVARSTVGRLAEGRANRAPQGIVCPATPFRSGSLPQKPVGPDNPDREVQPDPLSQARGNRGERQHRDGELVDLDPGNLVNSTIPGTRFQLTRQLL